MRAAWPGWPVAIATCGGAGYLPIPGSLGAALGLGIVVLAARLRLPWPWSGALLAGIAILIFFVGVWSAAKAEIFFHCKDPGYVVIDEVVGQIVTFMLRPEAAWKWLLTGFVVFRALDVIKPFPAGRAERLPAGWGIMADDLAAGLYSMLALTLIGLAVK